MTAVAAAAGGGAVEAAVAGGVGGVGKPASVAAAAAGGGEVVAVAAVGGVAVAAVDVAQKPVPKAHRDPPWRGSRPPVEFAAAAAAAVVAAAAAAKGAPSTEPVAPSSPRPRHTCCSRKYLGVYYRPAVKKRPRLRGSERASEGQKSTHWIVSYVRVHVYT